MRHPLLSCVLRFLVFTCTNCVALSWREGPPWYICIYSAYKICGGAHLGIAFVSVRPDDEYRRRAMQARAHKGRFFVLKRLSASHNLLRQLYVNSMTTNDESAPRRRIFERKRAARRSHIFPHRSFDLKLHIISFNM